MDRKLVSIIESYRKMLELKNFDDDALYERLVNERRFGGAEKMLREKAKTMFKNTKIIDFYGFPKVVYHGTDSEFKKFSNKFIGSHSHGIDKNGFFFVDDESYAEAVYSSGSDYNSIACFLNIENPEEYETDGKPETMWDKHPNEYSTNAIESGMDGVVVHGFTEDSKNNGMFSDDEWEEMQSEKSDITMYVAFEPNQIKIAGITYDGDTLIPLSRRFDATTDDIRY